MSASRPATGISALVGAAQARKNDNSASPKMIDHSPRVELQTLPAPQVSPAPGLPSLSSAAPKKTDNKDGVTPTILPASSPMYRASSLRSGRIDSKAMLDNAVIFISNSALDEFKGGDGDLFNQLVIQFNRMGINANRLVQTATEKDVAEFKQQFLRAVPAATEQESREFRAITRLDAYEGKSYGDKLIQLMDDKKYKGKQKILYLGSRPDDVKDGLITRGSGSLFTAELLARVKALDVKVIVCCLELQFFSRSVHELPRLAAMVQQHLALADGIHFLNIADRNFYEKTILPTLSTGMPQVRVQPALIMHGQQIIPRVHAYQLTLEEKMNDGMHGYFNHHPTVIGLVADYYACSAVLPEDLNAYYHLFSSPARDNRLSIERGDIPTTPFGLTLPIAMPRSNYSNPTRAVIAFVSGACTANPLAESKHDVSVEALVRRPPNVLCFGLIRGNKGVLEAINLAHQFIKEKMYDNKVYIIGKYMGSDGLLKLMIQDIYDNKVANSELVTRYLDRIRAVDSGRNTSDDSNRLCNELFDELAARDLNRRSIGDVGATAATELEVRSRCNVEVHFNLSPTQLLEYVMLCRYTMKFDNKGFANNASSILSAIAGMSLPTFAQVGMLTASEYRTNCRYKGALILLGDEPAPSVRVEVVKQDKKQAAEKSHSRKLTGVQASKKEDKQDRVKKVRVQSTAHPNVQPKKMDKNKEGIAVAKKIAEEKAKLTALLKEDNAAIKKENGAPTIRPQDLKSKDFKTIAGVIHAESKDKTNEAYQKRIENIDTFRREAGIQPEQVARGIVDSIILPVITPDLSASLLNVEDGDAAFSGPSLASTFQINTPRPSVDAQKGDAELAAQFGVFSPTARAATPVNVSNAAAPDRMRTGGVEAAQDSVAVTPVKTITASAS